MRLQSIFSLVGFTSVAILAGCADTSTSTSEGDEVDFAAEQALVTTHSFKLGIDSIPNPPPKEFLKTISFSKDYGSGDDTFAATAIVTARVSYDVDTVLKVTADKRALRLKSIHGDVTGDWNTKAEVDVRVQLTGKAASNPELVRSMTKSAPLLKGKETLLFIPIPTGVDFGVASLKAGIEMALACELDASTTFAAKASTGFSGPIKFELGWDRTNDRGTVGGKKNHWYAKDEGSSAKFSPPAFEVTEGDAQFRARCGLQPSLDFELDLGNDTFNGAMGAKIVGEVYAEAEGRLDARARTWSADVDVGVQAQLDVFGGVTLFGRPQMLEKSFPLFGGPGDPKHFGQKHFEGKL